MQSLFPTEENVCLLTDLYELTMAAAYWSNQVNEPATFELYFRRLPFRRSYVLAAGLEQALQYICNLRFGAYSIEWVRSLPQFSGVDTGFFEYLRNYRFSGDVWAVPEGTPIFPLEPMLRITAPLIEAQILETYLLSVINMESMIATKASRVVRAAAGRGVVDFGSRRAHGPQASLLAARASYLAGCIGTSNVLAGSMMEIPVYGTAAHSFIMAFASEIEAFRAYHKIFPDSTVLLIDTYDTVAAARKVKEVNGSVVAVRIDSGNLLDLSKEVRKILDEDGLESVKIFASGDLNEYKMEELLQKGAPIDFFGVGTELVTSYDDPALGGVYKLVETTMDGETVRKMKVSAGKVSYPGSKQVFRFTKNSQYSHDLVALADEPPPSGGSPILREYIRGGKLVEEPPKLSAIRSRVHEELSRLPAHFQKISSVEDYPIVFSERIRAEMERMGR